MGIIGSLLFIGGTVCAATALLGGWGFIAASLIWGGLILMGGE